MISPKLRGAFAIGAALAVSVTLAPAAAAQTAPAPPPDIVRTKDGGMLRGTIIEKLANDHVEIVLPNGQSRTVPMADVEYAGPTASDPGTAPPAPAAAPPVAPLPAQRTDDEETPRATSGSLPATTIGAGTARLRFTSDQAGLTFYRRTGTSQGMGTGWWGGFGKNHGGPVVMNVQLDNFDRLCTAPCSVDMAAGTYRLGLALGDGDVIPADQAINAQGHLGLRGHLESYAGVRAAGWVVMLASLVAGPLVALHSQQQCMDVSLTYSHTVICTAHHPYMLPGLAIMGVGGIAGVIMVYQKDEAHID